MSNSHNIIDLMNECQKWKDECQTLNLLISDQRKELVRVNGLRKEAESKLAEYKQDLYFAEKDIEELKKSQPIANNSEPFGWFSNQGDFTRNENTVKEWRNVDWKPLYEHREPETNDQYAIGFNDGYKAGDEGDCELLAHVLAHSNMDDYTPKQATPNKAEVGQIINKVAEFVEVQENGPFDVKVLATAIRANLKYGDFFKDLLPPLKGDDK